MKTSTWFNVVSGVWLVMGIISFSNTVWLSACLIMSTVYLLRADVAQLTESKKEVCDAPGNDDLND